MICGRFPFSLSILSQGNKDCCSPQNLCSANHGNCKSDNDCEPGLVCGIKNCPWNPQLNASLTPDNCCYSEYLGSSSKANSEDDSKGGGGTEKKVVIKQEVPLMSRMRKPDLEE